MLRDRLPAKSAVARGLLGLASLLVGTAFFILLSRAHRDRPEPAQGLPPPPAGVVAGAEQAAAARRVSATEGRPSAPGRTRESLSARLATFLEVTENEEDPVAFENFFRRWISDLDASEVPAALAALGNASLEPEFAADVNARLARHWSAKQPEAALAWVQAQPPGPGRELAMENIAVVRSGQDLANASQWARQLPEGGERDRVMAAVATEAVRSDPVEALQLAADLPTSAANDELIRRATMEWTGSAPQKALAWARGIPDPEFRTRVLGGVAVAWGEKEPVKAAEFAVSELPAGRGQDDAVIGIGQRWAQRDPAASADWVATFPPGELRQAAVESIGAIWAQTDWRAAAAWQRRMQGQAAPR